MKTLRRFLSRLTSWMRSRQDEERLKDEIEEHLAMQTAEHLRAGLSPSEARRQAVLKFGAVEAIREDYRDQKGLPSLETFVQDTRHALRRLRKSPVFMLTTIVTGARHRCDNGHLHFGPRGHLEIAGGGEAKRIVSSR